MTDLEKFEFDPLQLYFGEPFIIHSDIANDIVINQPTIGDIIKCEKKLYSAVTTLIANSTMYRVQLWDMKLDWNKVSDFTLFCMLVGSLDVDSTKLLFGDLDFGKFELLPMPIEDSDEVKYILYNEEQNYIIDEETHLLMSNYIKHMFNMFPKTEKAKGKSTKEWIIQEDKENMEKHKNDGYSSPLLPLISSCLNHPGFKYKKNELKEVGIVEFMDSVQRIQVYESSTALLKGIYGGFVDSSKINKEEFNFMRDLTVAQIDSNKSSKKLKEEK